MPRLPRKGYFVRGQFVARDSATDLELKQERSEGGPSKTALKAQSTELQALGERLLELPKARLNALGLPERLLQALEQLAHTPKFGAIRRQRQFIGKLMRSLQAPQVQAIREALDENTQGTARETAHLHTLELWRARLCDDDGALTQWMALYPHTDAKQLRDLIRLARRDKKSMNDDAPQDPTQANKAGRQKRSWRDLFKLLDRILSQNTQPLNDSALADNSPSDNRGLDGSWSDGGGGDDGGGDDGGGGSGTD